MALDSGIPDACGHRLVRTGSGGGPSAPAYVADHRHALPQEEVLEKRLSRLAGASGDIPRQAPRHGLPLHRARHHSGLIDGLDLCQRHRPEAPCRET